MNTNLLQTREALCRTRTDDPFLTIVGRLSGPVPPGLTGSPEVAPQAATEDPSGPPERPQDAPTSGLGRSPLAGLEKLLAIAHGDWSDPDRMPDGDPPGTCDWGYCDDPATAWRWAEELGGWIPVCAEHAAPANPDGTFVCEACGGMFELEPGWDPHAEADAVFRPEEKADAAIVCEDCWRAMRAALPDLDARYQEHGL